MGFASNFGKRKIFLDNPNEVYLIIDRVINDYQLQQKYTEIILYGKDIGAIIGANYCNNTRCKINKLIMKDPIFNLPGFYWKSYLFSFFSEVCSINNINNKSKNLRWGFINSILYFQNEIWKNKINLSIPIFIISNETTNYTYKLGSLIKKINDINFIDQI